MKKALSILAAVAVMAVGTSAFADTIVNSKHDLSNQSSGSQYRANVTTQICVYCHTPHNANPSIPLWNRLGSSNQAQNLFRLYSGVGMANVSYKTGFTPESISLFCMSCHDGSALGGSTAIKNKPAGGTFTDTITNNGNAILASSKANFGNALMNTHPVNFVVNSNSQSDLAATTAGSMSRAGYTAMPLYKSTRPGDASTTLECSSCHAVHDPALAPFLRDTMSGSRLCLDCHIK
jgi:predicted CXXCH cytochrome family protein